ncbi:MAG: AzlC family ABC transporter permease [Erysipelotrichaceae bacterium]|nr:AzlC family ABC transporter permease [Erysipelotrichaceae bacterium]
MKRELYLKGIKDAMPIGVGYFTVSLTFGLQASMGGLSVIEATILSLSCLTSAGQFGGLELIIAQAGYFEIALTQLVLNMRYILMSTSLSQKINKNASIFQRMLVSHGITDEIYGVSMMQEGRISPYYSYGLMTSGMIGWGSGTFIGATLGNILPLDILNALGLALYGMFIAIIIPPAKHNRHIIIIIITTMITSSLFDIIPVFNQISSGFRIIIITLLLASLFAYLFPVKETINE